jgi:hypothetical protein
MLITAATVLFAALAKGVPFPPGSGPDLPPGFGRDFAEDVGPDVYEYIVVGSGPGGGSLAHVSRINIYRDAKI